MIRAGCQRPLASRNEGKLKAYESCEDCRAWSHDRSKRSQYLKQWIKSDMTKSVLPVSCLAGYLDSMTRKGRGDLTPRCHPDCKSKVLLDSIQASCCAMRECLRNDEKCSKYFVEEEFETSHWPCERCLEALKGIKMLWKLISERIFHVKYCSDDSGVHSSRSTSVRSLAKHWQREVITQTLLVSSFQRGDGEGNTRRHKHVASRVKCNSSGSNRSLRYRAKADVESISICSYQMCLKPALKPSCEKPPVRSIGCDASTRDQDEIKQLKSSLTNMQCRLEAQARELDRMREENNLLKVELQKKVNEINALRPSRPYTALCLKRDADKNRLRPFEGSIEDFGCSHATNTDSEMVITLKNCKNKHFRHVSLLQVIHKTNEPVSPVVSDFTISKPSFQHEDPLKLLTKVQNTFGAIVQREINMACDKKKFSKKCSIDSTYRGFHSGKGACSCTSIRTYNQGPPCAGCLRYAPGSSEPTIR
ncbi:hypothetical protein JYU34_002810 [Plutella xylostella]|uniref:Uncharacterized protein n=1 Tax=Plutella xylostella TaxID=51655 RepID=A0ABQ7R378_PLUXY|nr:hypothetical protein JYU34_002810 [Plutella xylostella]